MTERKKGLREGKVSKQIMIIDMMISPLILVVFTTVSSMNAPCFVLQYYAVS
jgi:hypothetical protein